MYNRHILGLLWCDPDVGMPILAQYVSSVLGQVCLPLAWSRDIPVLGQHWQQHWANTTMHVHWANIVAHVGNAIW